MLDLILKLSPYASYLECLIIFAVLGYVGLRYRTQRKSLEQLLLQIGSERKELETARGRFDKYRGLSPIEALHQVESGVPHHSLLKMRLFAADSGASTPASNSVARGASHILEQARYWAGSFTFIGLCGTLACLGLAVAFLIATINRSGGAPSSGLQDVVSHIKGVFGGMGTAFLSTGVAVLFTLKLAGFLSTVERAWESLCQEIDEFVTVSVGPLIAQKREQNSEIYRMERVVEQMTQLTSAFNDGLTSSVGTLQSIQSTTETLTKGLTVAAKKLDGATNRFDLSTNQLSQKVDELTSILGEHRGAIGTHNESVAGLSALVERYQNQQNDSLTSLNTALGQMQSAIQDAQRVFLQLEEERKDLISGVAEARQDLLSDLAEARDELLRQFNEGKEESSQHLVASRQELVSHLTSISEVAQAMSDSGQRVLNGTREQVKRSLQGVVDAVSDGVAKEDALLQRFTEILHQMGQYAAHVEDTIRSLPLTIGEEPILQIEPFHRAELQAMSERLQRTNDGIGELRDEIQRALHPGLGKALHSANEHFGQLTSAVAGLNGSMAALAAGDSAIAQRVDVVAHNLVTLESKLSAVTVPSGAHLSTGPQAKVEAASLHTDLGAPTQGSTSRFNDNAPVVHP